MDNLQRVAAAFYMRHFCVRACIFNAAIACHKQVKNYGASRHRRLQRAAVGSTTFCARYFDRRLELTF